jgi:hypothetical protein
LRKELHPHSHAPVALFLPGLFYLPFKIPFKRDKSGSKLLYDPAKSSNRFVKVCKSALFRLFSS